MTCSFADIHKPKLELDLKPHKTKDGNHRTFIPVSPFYHNLHIAKDANNILVYDLHGPSAGSELLCLIKR